MEFRARLSHEVECLTPMHNRKNVVDGFAFSVLVNGDGAGRLEPTKA